jgi:hypothetical protein
MDTTAWKTVLLLVALVLCTSPMVQACGTMENVQGHASSLGTYSLLPQKESCTPEGLDQCKYACKMPGGVVDMKCYESCLYSICS